VESDEIVSARTALRYLARGDDPAKRARLAAILLAFALLACVVVLTCVAALIEFGMEVL
jgi:hypothetical protein